MKLTKYLLMVLIFSSGLLGCAEVTKDATALTPTILPSSTAQPSPSSTTQPSPYPTVKPSLSPTSPPPPTPTCVPVLYTEPEEIFVLETTGTIFNMASADFNDDGQMDVVFDRNKFQTAETYEIEIMVNDGNGGIRLGTSEIFEGPVPRVQHPRQMLIADFNGDGRSDIFIADHGQDIDPFPGYQNTLVLSSPGGRLMDATSNLPQQSDFTHSAAFGDIDGDGDLDLYVGNLYGGDGSPPQVWVNDGSGVFSIEGGHIPGKFTDIPINTYTSNKFADVNKDGFVDLILGGDSISQSVVLLNDGTGQFAEVPDAIPPKPWSEEDIASFIGTDDFDGDGLQDLIIAFTSIYYQGRYLQILINNGDATFRDETENRLPQTDTQNEWIITIQLVDLDHNGSMDITTNTMGGESVDLPIYLNDGNGFFSSLSYTLPKFQAWQHVFVDLDGDGGQDILSSATPWLTDVETLVVIRDIGCK